MIHRFNDAFDYIYPRVLSIPHQHIIFKNQFLAALIEQPVLIYVAVESDQISKFREADRGVKRIRWMLQRAPTLAGVKFGKTGSEEAERRLAVIGGMIGACINRINSEKADREGRNKQ